MIINKKITFVGAGQMCEAIFSGLIASGAAKAENICAIDVNEDRLIALEEKYKIETMLNGNICDKVSSSDIIILAIKPQMAKDVLKEIKEFLNNSHTVISIMGGVPIDFISQYTDEASLVRVMPNTPMLVRKGACGISFHDICTEESKADALEIFQNLGIAMVLEEKHIDALTSLSGCGPAFAYMMIEAMADAGVELGLPRDMSYKLAAQTLAGSGEMVIESGKNPAMLKDAVCSPGGGTIAGVHSLENDGFRSAVMNAVTSSYERMVEVGKKASK